MQNWNYTYNYASNGNMTYKSDAGYLYYEISGKPHLLSEKDMYYDENKLFHANSADNCTTEYTPFHKIKKITEGEYTLEFTYGTDQQRIKTVLRKNGVGVKTKYFIGGIYEYEPGSKARELSYFYTDYCVGIHVRENYTSDSMFYVFTDHLGSFDRIVDQNGNLRDIQSFDAWGNRRNPSNWQQHEVENTTHLFSRGFTGHEHLDHFKIINMNGRLYDPVVGRFFSVDPFVQAPDFSQNYNRYSYCLNNPIMYTDPSGEFIFSYTFNFFKGLFSGKNPLETGWNAVVNEAKLYGGLFISDETKNFGGQLWEIVSRFTWQAPQTLLGFSFSYWSNNLGGVTNVEYYRGATVVNNNLMKESRAVTLGSYIIGGSRLKADPNTSLFQHEYGHYLQSQKWGWAYMGKVAIPSIVSLISNKDYHDYHPVEQDANVRAYKYFTEHNPGFSDWNFTQIQ